MNPSPNPTDTSGLDHREINYGWELQAWVCFVWVAVGYRAYYFMRSLPLVVVR